MTRLASVAGAIAAVAAIWRALDQIAMRLDAIDHQLAERRWPTQGDTA